MNRVLSLLALVLFPFEFAGAQIITGTLRGTVADELGERITGAAVTITSPALLGGPSTVATNDEGQFRFFALENLDLVADPDENFVVIMKDGEIYKNEE